MRQQMPLDELIEAILQSMEEARYYAGTIRNFQHKFSRLLELAAQREEKQYSAELGQAFIEDRSYARNKDYCHSRYLYHCRCVNFIESYICDGKVDWSVKKLKPQYSLKSADFSNAKKSFESLMVSNNLSKNTKDGYRRLVHYFLKYLEDKGYCSLFQICNGDVVSFIVMVCKEHYQPTSLNSHLPGLKMFLNMSEVTRRFEIELPERLQRKREILKVYSDEEHERILQYLEDSDIPIRDRAICLIALETGLRAIDICNLKLESIDWQHDCIHIVQEKTKHAIEIPLKASYGNAIADYLLSERPTSESEYVFLQQNAPFAPINSHSVCYKLLRKAVAAAGVESNGRINGTRITRHSMATRMLRNGIPLSVISAALGHGDPNSVMIYLSTEDAKLAECTLPLPKAGGAYAK